MDVKKKSLFYGAQISFPYLDLNSKLSLVMSALSFTIFCNVAFMTCYLVLCYSSFAKLPVSWKTRWLPATRYANYELPTCYLPVRKLYKHRDSLMCLSFIYQLYKLWSLNCKQMVLRSILNYHCLISIFSPSSWKVFERNKPESSLRFCIIIIYSLWCLYQDFCRKSCLGSFSFPL